MIREEHKKIRGDLEDVFRRLRMLEGAVCNGDDTQQELARIRAIIEELTTRLYVLIFGNERATELDEIQFGQESQSMLEEAFRRWRILDGRGPCDLAIWYRYTCTTGRCVGARNSGTYASLRECLQGGCEGTIPPDDLPPPPPPLPPHWPPPPPGGGGDPPPGGASPPPPPPPPPLPPPPPGPPPPPPPPPGSPCDPPNGACCEIDDVFPPGSPANDDCCWGDCVTFADCNIAGHEFHEGQRCRDVARCTTGKVPANDEWHARCDAPA